MSRRWRKRGLAYQVAHGPEWMASHAQVPFAMPIRQGELRVFFSTRDHRNRAHTAFVDVDAQDYSRTIQCAEQPALAPGERGNFDDAGAMPSWFVQRDDAIWLYYIGWSLAVDVPYRLAIGLAVSRDGGVTFERHAPGPILDRNAEDACWVSNPCVIPFKSGWRMYYIACTDWIFDGDQLEPRYLLRVTDSLDGIQWSRPRHTCLSYDEVSQAYARPHVYFEDGFYKMLYCVRGARDFRHNPLHTYRMGYAESEDGVRWTRDDAQAPVQRSAQGWDSEMVAYPFLFDYEGRRTLFYNGNGFGREGFGYADLV